MYTKISKIVITQIVYFPVGKFIINPDPTGIRNWIIWTKC